MFLEKQFDLLAQDGIVNFHLIHDLVRLSHRYVERFAVLAGLLMLKNIEVLFALRPPLLLRLSLVLFGG